MPKNKNQIKKTSKLKEKQQRKKKNIVIVSIALLIIILLIVFMIFLGKSKKITCSKKVNEKKVLMNSDITFKIKDKKIKYIVVKKNISIDNDNDDINYLDAIKSALDSNYKKQGIEYKIEKKSDKLIIDLKYNKEKKYILDNLYIGMENTGASINIVSEDRENNYATIDLSKEYDDKKIIKIMGKADYFCK